MNRMKTKLIILLILTTMIHTNTVNAQHSQLKRADFQQTIDGKQTDLYFLRNKNGIEIARSEEHTSELQSH